MKSDRRRLVWREEKPKQIYFQPGKVLHFFFLETFFSEIYHTVSLNVYVKLDWPLFSIYIPTLLRGQEVSYHCRIPPPSGQLTIVPDVGEQHPALFLHLLILTFTFQGSLLPQPQGREQVDPPLRHLPSYIREEQARVSRALQGHILKQRGKVPPTTPRISSYCFLFSTVPLTLALFWTPQHSL